LQTSAQGTAIQGLKEVSFLEYVQNLSGLLLHRPQRKQPPWFTFPSKNHNKKGNKEVKKASATDP